MEELAEAGALRDEHRAVPLGDATVEVRPDFVLNGRLDPEVALDVAARIVAARPDLLGDGSGDVTEAAGQVAAMARIFRAFLAEE